MAPERASGRVADGRSDLYSVGCLLYAMLTGAPPYRADDPVGVLYQHMHAPAPSLHERRGDVPAGVEELVSQLLAKDPDDRPASAADVGARLRALADGGGDAPAATKLLPLSPRPRRPTRRQAAVAGAILTLAALVVAVVLSARDDSPPSAQGASETTQAAPTVTTSAPRTPTPTAVATDPASRVQQLRSALDRHVRAGNVDADAAGKIRDDLREIEEKRREGKLDDAADHVVDMRERLHELADEGRITAAARTELVAATDRLASSLPPPARDHDDEDDDEERGKKDKDEDGANRTTTET